MADSNVAAQQEGIAALGAFLKGAGPQACTRTRAHAIPALVEKGLSSTRATTKSNALEALLLYVELDQAGPVIDEIMPTLANKQPKVIAAVLHALTAICHAYGCKTVDPKPILKVLPKVFGHADKNVRAEGQNLAVELYRWLREPMKAVFWAELKPVQQQDLEARFEKVKDDPAPHQERLLRSQQEAAAAASTQTGHEEGSESADGFHGDDAPELDTFDLVEPVDVSSKIPGNLYENLASTTWKDRKDGLDALLIVVNVPRIKDADFNDLVRALSKCMKDANIAVVTVAANCVEALAKGLRAPFAKHRPVIMAPMLERLKEKKQSVTDALGAALDAVFSTTGLSDCLDEMMEFFRHKNPQVKLESVRFLIRCLRTTKEAPNKTKVKLIADAAVKLLTESSEVLRLAAAEVLGTVMKIMGERAMNPYLDGLDDIRKIKIKEFYEKAKVRARDTPKPVPTPAPVTRPAKQGTSKAAGGGKKPVSTASKNPLSPPPSLSSAAALSDDPLPSRPTTRGIPSKTVGLSKPGMSLPGTGLKSSRTLAGSGDAAPASASPAANSASSRPALSPVEAANDSAPTPRPGLGGRGLTSRPLGKPIVASNSSDSTATMVTPAAATTASSTQLDELRSENERLQCLLEDLRSDRARQQSRIHDLQNQNAELIDDHTRDVLTIKAKETQLVRARGDAEAAEQMCQKQQREMERLKRELSRAVRAASPGPSVDAHEQIYRDTASNGLSGAGVSTYSGLNSGRPANRRPLYTTTTSLSGEEKENGDPPETLASDSRAPAKLSPSLSSTIGSGTSGRASPAVGGSRHTTTASTSAGIGAGLDSSSHGGSTMANGEGIESWKRAAEVTSALKARIEQMKV